MKYLQVLVLTCLVGSRAASADSLPMNHSTRLLPTFELDAGPTGKAKLKIGASFTHAYHELADLTVQGVYETATSDGFAQLFSLSEDKVTSPDWKLGGAITVSYLRPFDGLPSPVIDADRRAFETCLATCVEPIAPTNKPFCDAANQARVALSPQPELLDPTKLNATQIYEIWERADLNPLTQYCPAGVAIVTEVRAAVRNVSANARDVAATIPRLTFSGGVLAGSSRFEFLRPDNDDPTRFMPDEIKRASFTAVGQAVYVNDQLITLEVAMRYQSKLVAQSSKARWCVPAGSVTHAGMDVPGEICSERSLGVPKRSRLAELAVYGGVVSAAKTTRVSLGLFTAEAPTDAGPDRRTYGLRFPVMLSTDIMPGTGVYKGVLRLTPTITIIESGDADDVDTQFFVTLEVFTSRSLFGTAIDAF